MARPVKLLAIVVLLFACGKKSETVDHWPEVVRMATPAIPGADGALLDSALGTVVDGDVPQASLEAAIAWRKAGGGISWRTGPPTALDIRPFQLGEALLAHHADDPAAMATVVYLAYRLRAENTDFLGVAMGFALTQRVLDKHLAWQPAYAAWAPTEAEIRRGLAAEAVMALDPIPPNDKVGRPAMTRWFAELLVGAPRERAAFLAHVDRMLAQPKSPDLELVMVPKLRQRLAEMYKTIDEYHAWQDALPKP